jgi:mannose-6-phosphate isomerase
VVGDVGLGEAVSIDITRSERAMPIRLDANQPADRFYRGGERIVAFRRGRAAPEDRVPEDWIGSTTCVRGQAPLGMTILPSGIPLADAVADRPEWWLGSGHYARFGADTKLLVKLLDAGERLPIHAHPDSSFARTHLGAAHGKAEAWHILSSGVIYLGLTRDLRSGELRAIVDSQQTDALLAAMHRIAVQPGNRVYVPPGVLHSIGPGVLLAEVQEPEDLSILLEWKGFRLDGPRDGHLGLGFNTALEAVDRAATSPATIASLVSTSTGACTSLPSLADEYFRLERTEVTEQEVSIPTGEMTIAAADGACSATAGDTFVVPAAAGALALSGRGALLVARPPTA